MNTLVHRRHPATHVDRPADRPPLRLLERWPRQEAAAPASEPAAHSGWLERSLDAYFAWGEGMHYAHRFGSWERLR